MFKLVSVSSGEETNYFANYNSGTIDTKEDINKFIGNLIISLAMDSLKVAESRIVVYGDRSFKFEELFNTFFYGRIKDIFTSIRCKTNYLVYPEGKIVLSIGFNYCGSFYSINIELKVDRDLISLYN